MAKIASSKTTSVKKTAPASKKAAFKVPKNPAECADLLFMLQEERRALSRAADDMEKKEKLIKAYLIDTVPKKNSTGVAGKLARVTIEPKVVPQVKDIKKFHAYIVKNDAWDLLRAQLVESAVKERWDAKKVVPGVETFNTVVVRLNKVK